MIMLLLLMFVFVSFVYILLINLLVGIKSRIEWGGFKCLIILFKLDIICKWFVKFSVFV